VATGSGLVRLLEVEPTKDERYAHAAALMALLSKQTAAAQTTKAS
jgi:hypothetical protein